MFAASFHPAVVEFFVSHLAAATTTVDELLRHGGPSRDEDPADELEARIARLESVLSGVGAVLRTLTQSLAPSDQPRPD